MFNHFTAPFFLPILLICNIVSINFVLPYHDLVSTSQTSLIFYESLVIT